MRAVHYLRFSKGDDGHVCVETPFRGDAADAFFVMLAMALDADASRITDAAERFSRLSPREQRYWMSFVYRAGPVAEEMGSALGPEN